jgi:hypothetical protein
VTGSRDPPPGPAAVTYEVRHCRGEGPVERCGARGALIVSLHLMVPLPLLSLGMKTQSYACARGTSGGGITHPSQCQCQFVRSGYSYEYPAWVRTPFTLEGGAMRSQTQKNTVGHTYCLSTSEVSGGVG